MIKIIYMERRLQRFDHDQFAIDCENSEIDMMVSYNSSQLVKDRFSKWDLAEFDLTYTMRSVRIYERSTTKKELLLVN